LLLAEVHLILMAHPFLIFSATKPDLEQELRVLDFMQGPLLVPAHRSVETAL
jgi:hypothetical protein